MNTKSEAKTRLVDVCRNMQEPFTSSELAMMFTEFQGHKIAFSSFNSILLEWCGNGWLAATRAGGRGISTLFVRTDKFPKEGFDFTPKKPGRKPNPPKLSPQEIQWRGFMETFHRERN